MTLEEAIEQLVQANRIISHEGVLDAFGHVSARHPQDPGKFLLSRSLAPSLVRPEDILIFDLDSKPAQEYSCSFYAERVIHGEIYKARPDVHGVCHHHAPPVLTFAISNRKLTPVSQLGAAIGHDAPSWDSQNEFGDTNLLLVKPEEGRSLAKALGPNWLVLMRRHGATCVGRSIQEMTFRTIHSTANADLLLRAMAVGDVESLTSGEIDRAGEIKPLAVERAWDYWKQRLPDERRSA
jgi:HCOMODA/2-hydroxy-3-carboxy-muconic semialdehyde decarboxylase